MSHKILFYLDLFTLHFALANYLQNNIDCELFALIDTTDKPKRFFENQEIVHFKKSWFYHDEIDTKMKPDLKYISEFSPTRSDLSKKLSLFVSFISFILYLF